MVDKHAGSDSPNQSNCSESYNAYLQRAASACEAGDLVLGMYLYLAAYEKAAADPAIPDGTALAGLQEAWHLACDLKERSMAEHVFEQLEPFLMPEEVSAYADELQNLALDRLEEFGFSREELQDMAEMISQDLIGPDGSVVKVESFSLPSLGASGLLGGRSTRAQDPDEGARDEAKGQEARDKAETAIVPAADAQEAAPSQPHPAKAPKMGLGVADVNDFNPYDMLNTSSVGTSYYNATNEGSGGFSFTLDKDRAAEAQQGEGGSAKDSLHQRATEAAEAIAKAMEGMPSANDGRANGQANLVKANGGSKEAPAPKEAAPKEARIIGPKQELEATEAPAQPRRLTYRNLVGYDEAVDLMRDFGIGLQRDQGFQNFIAMLNSRHGLQEMPALDTMLFRAPVIEDASRFLEATAGELGLPVLRMSMEENVQGMPVLCVSTQGKNRPRMNHAQNRFEGPGILVIEDLYLWSIPAMPDGMDGLGGFMMANISRGAREAVNLIRSAVEDPEVYVFATATMNGDVDPFFYELLEPMTVIDIGDPTAQERSDIWAEIMDRHPSMRGLDRRELTRLSANLSRYDIYMAAREAIEEAYKTGLVQRMFVPVSTQNIYDKLAACHMLESEEYRLIEDEIVREFRDGLDDLDGLMDGPSGAWY